jgi:S-(hydroxymethyl)glutathione dehydrogenase/alcohol dehydrogenase
MSEKADRPIVRRKVLKAGAAAWLAGAAAWLAGAAAKAQQPASPALLTGAQAGRRFRAWLGNAASGAVEDLELLPIQDRQVLVRTEASAPCYTLVLNGIGGTPSIVPPQPLPFGPVPGGAPTILNHTFVGIVEAVGPGVRRVQAGDRVIVGVTSQCGQCYACLHGRADACQFTFGVTGGFPPIAKRADGTPVGAQLGIGGLSELNVVYEEYTCPVFTTVSPAELSLLGDTAATGIAAATCLMRVEPGSDVAVLGAGALGTSAIQGARIAGAAQIVAIEPIRRRRDLALKLGATTVLDPNQEGNNLVERVRELCKGPTDRLFAGGRSWSTTRGADNRGADFTIEAVGRCGDRPTVEQPPDPTGILPMQQAWQFTRRGGSLIYLGFGQAGDVSYPASQFANNGRTVFSGQQGGLNMMRDLPGFVRLVERGQLDLKSLVTSTWPLERTREAFQVLSDRTEMCPVVVFS